jgi:hypothetical protein
MAVKNLRNTAGLLRGAVAGQQQLRTKATRWQHED